LGAISFFLAFLYSPKPFLRFFSLVLFFFFFRKVLSPRMNPLLGGADPCLIFPKPGPEPPLLETVTGWLCLFLPFFCGLKKKPDNPFFFFGFNF